MAYIQLDQKYPGIVSLLMYDKKIAKHLTAMAQEVMRRPASLSTGERELIAAFVSKLNDCQFCYRSHAACALGLMDPTLVEEVLHEGYVENLSTKMRALLVVALDVQELNRGDLVMSMALAKKHASDREIHDTVFIASFFSMCNRYVDGLGATFQPGEEIQGGVSLAKYGYKMTFRRFFGEILPKMWKQWWA